MLKDNAYFRQMQQHLNDLYKISYEHESKEQTTIEEYGFNSAEYKKFKKEKESIHSRFPTDGEWKAVRAWENSETDELKMYEHLWDKEVADFVEALRLAGIKSFIYTNHSTSTMNNICDFIKQGCVFEGVYIPPEGESEFDSRKKKGLRFSL